jgi:hypothetical protein
MYQRLLLPSLLFFYFSVQSSAQWSVGISAGPNLSFRDWRAWNQSMEFDLDYAAGVAFSSALIGQWSANSVLALRGEAGYAVWRNHLDIEMTNDLGSGFKGTVADDLHAFTGGLFAKITPFRQKRFYFLTGPSGAYIFKNQTRLDKNLAEETGLPRNQTQDLQERFIRQGQLFINLGAGTVWTLGTRGQISLELRHQLGLNNFSTGSTVDARISSLMLNVGYLYQL